MKQSIKLFPWVISVLLLSEILAGTITPASAETRNQLTVANLDTSQFPSISFYFWAFDGAGAFVKDVTTSEAHILENGTVLAADSIEMLEPGVRLITVINEGPTLANRYQMVARIDRIKQALITWAQSEPATSMDDFSLLNNQGPVTSNQTDPADWVTALDNYQPDLKAATPGLAGLSAAIDQALTSTGSTRKTPAILYVTPLPEDSQMSGLNDLIEKARSSDIRLFIWLVGPADYAANEKTLVLMNAAEQTNGDFFLFSGAEELPTLASYLDPLKYVYKVTYSSAVKTGGNQSLAVQVRRQGVVLDSSPLTFPLEVATPNPIFLSPPASVTRTWVQAETSKKKDYVLTPDTIEIDYLLEFPDGHQRTLAYARLFVDGRMVAENTAAPFDVFTWDISQYQQSGTHQLKVTIEDTVGLKAETIEVPVDLVVAEKPLTWFQRLTKRINLLTLIPILLVVAAGVLLILIGWKTVRRRINKKAVRSHRLQDPVTQPVEIAGDTLVPAARAETASSWPRIPGYGAALARLVLISGGKPEVQEKHEIAIGEFELTLGSDATKAKALLNYPLVSPLHARISVDEEKRFRIADEGSTAGTWLNYAPVSKTGARLEHGDVVQLGKAVFRFEQLGAENKKLKVTPVGDEK